MRTGIKSAVRYAAVALCAISLVGCGANKQENEKSIGSGVETAQTVVSVNGKTRTVGELQYYIYVAAMQRAQKVDGSFTGDTTKIDWNQKTEEGITLEEAVLRDAVDTMVGDCLIVQKGEENGLELTDEEKQQLEEIDHYLQTNGEEQLLNQIKVNGISSVDDYKKLMRTVQMVDKVKEDVSANRGRYITDEESLKRYKNDQMVTVQHILIMNDSTKVEDPKAAIESVLERARAGEDFVALLQEYNEDPGETIAGYTFGPGEMVKEFEEAAFKLDYDEISDVVQSEYGYHIIKRLLGLAELKGYWNAQAKIEKNQQVLDQISVQGILNMVQEARGKIQESGAKANG